MSTERHLALHLDVNMTVTAFDSKMGYSPAVVINRHLVSTTWLAAATQEAQQRSEPTCSEQHPLLAESRFHFLSAQPSVDPPPVPPHLDAATVGSFHDFMTLMAPLRSPTVFPTRSKREWRDQYTQDGFPGACFRPHFEAIYGALLWPPHLEADPDFTFQPHIHNHPQGHHHQYHHEDSHKGAAHSHHNHQQHQHQDKHHPQHNYQFLLPSFCSFFLETIRANRSFTIVFRTFGHDGQRVLRCLARLANGEHPLFPFTPGDANESVAFVPFAFEIRHSRGGDVALVPSQQESSLVPPCLHSKFCPESVLSKARQCNSLETLQCLPRTVALVLDDYDHWNRTGGKQVGGKPLFVDETDDTVHPILFDDHIWFDPEDSIADLRIRNPSSGLFESVKDQVPYRNLYLVRAALIESLSQPDYYKSYVSRCEEQRKSHGST